MYKVHTHSDFKSHIKTSHMATYLDITQYTLNGVKDVMGPLHDLINNGQTYIKKAIA